MDTLTIQDLQRSNHNSAPKPVQATADMEIYQCQTM